MMESTFRGVGQGFSKEMMTEVNLNQGGSCPDEDVAEGVCVCAFGRGSNTSG